MSAWLIALTGLIYFYVTCEQLWLRNWPLAFMYFGYAFANIGAYWLAIKGV
jgi:hypothetical protein